MIKRYRWNLSSDEKLSKTIEGSAGVIGDSVQRIENNEKKISENCLELKETRPEVTRLKAKVDSLEEYDPSLTEKYNQMKENISDLSSSVNNSSETISKEIKEVLDNIKKVSIAADTLLYRESKLLDSYTKKISKKEDIKLRDELMLRIMTLKEDMKKVARISFEAADIEIDLYNKHKPISDVLSRLGIDIGSVGDILNDLKIDNIDDIIDNSRKELKDIKEIKLEVSLIMSRIHKVFDKTIANIEILPKDSFDIINQRLREDLEEFNKLKDYLKRQTGMLLIDVKIHEG